MLNNEIETILEKQPAHTYKRVCNCSIGESHYREPATPDQPNHSPIAMTPDNTERMSMAELRAKPEYKPPEALPNSDATPSAGGPDVRN